MNVPRLGAHAVRYRIAERDHLVIPLQVEAPDQIGHQWQELAILALRQRQAFQASGEHLAMGDGRVGKSGPVIDQSVDWGAREQLHGRHQHLFGTPHGRQRINDQSDL